LKNVGDSVSAGEALAEIETDKTLVQLQACEPGILTERTLDEGATAAPGDALAIMKTKGESAKNSNVINVASPLARKLAEEAGIDPAEINGTGPRGKIMVQDVRKALALSKDTPAQKVHVPLAPKDARQASRVDDYYLYSLEANMAYLAAISTPIAVQCEKLLGSRYSLFDYVVRAAVKACISRPEWKEDFSDVELLMALDKGEQFVLLNHAQDKTIYNIAMSRIEAQHRQKKEEISVTPDVILCDSGVNVGQVRALFPAMPRTIVGIGGTSPKTGIEAGRPVSKLILPVTLYVNARLLPETVASKIAAEFKTLLENPVLLLL
jgi:pyruvate/2-oxoglutarate dehydrogenase complex dihydrolipoamide acyltransferase (E2) component